MDQDYISCEFCKETSRTLNSYILDDFETLMLCYKFILELACVLVGIMHKSGQVNSVIINLRS